MSDSFTQARQIILLLKEQGVRSFCLSPGSWSTPLAEAISREEGLEKTVHFDERAMAFFALGQAKGSGRPVALITTSGTAVGNLLPAIMEADRSLIPLIVLTADRPPELQQCGANQTSEQAELFRPFVRYVAALPPASSETTPWVLQTVAEALHKSTYPLPGPVHINWRLRKPFVSTLPFQAPKATRYIRPTGRLGKESLEELASLLSSEKNGAILLGELPQNMGVEPILQLSKKLGFPIIADVLSGMRGAFPSSYFELLQKEKKERFSLLLQLGERLVLHEFPEEVLEKENFSYLVIANHDRRYDPNHLVTHRICADPLLFCEELLPLLPEKGEYSLPAPEIELPLEKWEKISELHIPYLLSLLEKPPTLFIGSSMPIRDFSLLYYPKVRGEVYANRGLSGIDGNIATAIGIARAKKEPLMIVIGDQTFLHDLSSLFLLDPEQDKIALVVINNGGGGIFSFLPIKGQSADFGSTFAAEHTHHFGGLASCFPLTKAEVHTLSDWKRCLTKWEKKPELALFEVFTDREENVLLHKELRSSTIEKLCCHTR